MHEFTDKTIREIALEAPLTTRIFEEFKIDFCCGGRVPFTDACRNAGVDPFIVATKLEKVLDEKPDASAAEEKGPRELIAHIVDTHHAFTRSEIDRLRPLAAKVAGKHGENHPELTQVRDVFDELAAELLPHMQKEEMVLFPYIERLTIAAEKGLPAPLPHFGTVQNPVRMMMFEHDRAGDLLRQLRNLSNEYSAPADACPSYKGLYAGLEDLERDLHRHIHLENNVLFPRAVELEAPEAGLAQGAKVF
jgi:regulator of cell morphogenesis and NO signaling